MKTRPPYRKHIYWLDPRTHQGLIDELAKDKKNVYKAKHHPCESLYPRRERVLVVPGIWDMQCRRQGSWYRASSRKGLFLLVTNQPFDTLEPRGILTIEPFEPPRTASDEDVLEILSDERVPALLPEGWGLFSPWELQAIHRYLLGEGIERSLQEIFSYYTSNHVNFVYPRFYLDGPDGGIIPYSIQKTALVCSACVEIFGILGEAFPLKYLVPCPGLKYVKPEPGRYLRVETLGTALSP